MKKVAELRGNLDVQCLSGARFADQRRALPDLHGFGTRTRVAQLFLVTLFRVRMASDQMSQHLRLSIGLAKEMYDVPSIAPCCGARDVAMSEKQNSTAPVRS